MTPIVIGRIIYEVFVHFVCTVYCISYHHICITLTVWFMTVYSSLVLLVFSSLPIVPTIVSTVMLFSLLKFLHLSTTSTSTSTAMLILPSLLNLHFVTSFVLVSLFLLHTALLHVIGSTPSIRLSFLKSSPSFYFAYRPSSSYTPQPSCSTFTFSRDYVLFNIRSDYIISDTGRYRYKSSYSTRISSNYSHTPTLGPLQPYKYGKLRLFLDERGITRPLSDLFKSKMTSTEFLDVLSSEQEEILSLLSGPHSSKESTDDDSSSGTSCFDPYLSLKLQEALDKYKEASKEEEEHRSNFISACLALNEYLKSKGYELLPSSLFSPGNQGVRGVIAHIKRVHRNLYTTSSDKRVIKRVHEYWYAYDKDEDRCTESAKFVWEAINVWRKGYGKNNFDTAVNTKWAHDYYVDSEGNVVVHQVGVHLSDDQLEDSSVNGQWWEAIYCILNYEVTLALKLLVAYEEVTRTSGSISNISYSLPSIEAIPVGHLLSLYNKDLSLKERIVAYLEANKRIIDEYLYATRFNLKVKNVNGPASVAYKKACRLYIQATMLLQYLEYVSVLEYHESFCAWWSFKNIIPLSRVGYASGGWGQFERQNLPYGTLLKTRRTFKKVTKPKNYPAHFGTDLNLRFLYLGQARLNEWLLSHGFRYFPESLRTGHPTPMFLNAKELVDFNKADTRGIGSTLDLTSEVKYIEEELNDITNSLIPSTRSLSDNEVAILSIALYTFQERLDRVHSVIDWAYPYSGDEDPIVGVPGFPYKTRVTPLVTKLYFSLQDCRSKVDTLRNRFGISHSNVKDSLGITTYIRLK